MSGVMAFGRLDGNEVAVVAVSLPVTVLVDGATMMVVGNQDSEESVIVEMGTKLLPRLSEDTVVMLGRVAEVVVASSEVNEEVVSVSVAGTVALGGSETVVGSSAVDVGSSSVVEFWDTVASVVVGTNEVLIPDVGGRSVMVVLAVIGGNSSVVVSPPEVVIVVPLLISVGLGGGEVVVVIPVPGPVAEGSTVSTEVEVGGMIVVPPVPGPVADGSIILVEEAEMPVPEPVAEVSIVLSADVAEVTPVPGPVTEGSTV